MLRWFSIELEEENGAGTMIPSCQRQSTNVPCMQKYGDRAHDYRDLQGQILADDLAFRIVEFGLGFCSNAAVDVLRTS